MTMGHGPGVLSGVRHPRTRPSIPAPLWRTLRRKTGERRRDGWRTSGAGLVRSLSVSVSVGLGGAICASGSNPQTVEGGHLAVDDAGTAASALLSPLNCLVQSYPLLV
jgi:hypothetical protein